ncbi:MAG TPA: hypothetical protein ENJ26_01855, partial [Rhodobacteraceae bacterium]|nr:hypothetical protein [Paracoccaceae bacterium]
LEQLNANDLTITVEDARSGQLWQITDGGVQIRHGQSGLDIAIDFDVFNGTEELAETIIGIRTDKASSAAAVGTTFANAAAADIALQSPALSFLGVLDAPISGALRAEFDTSGALDFLAGTLEFGQGALQPGQGVEPLGFDDAKAYFEFSPEEQKLEFSEVSLNSDTASVVARGHAYLREFEDGWPSVFLGQFSLSDIKVHPKHLYDQPITFAEGATDLRVRLSPFTVEVGQFVLLDGAERLVAKGRAEAGDQGWELAADIAVNQIDDQRLLALWPVSIVPRTRVWLDENIRSAHLKDVKGAIRLTPGQDPRLLLGWNFEDTTVRYIRTQPEIENASGFATIENTTFTLSVEQGSVTAPQGGVIDVAGSSFQIPDVTRKPAHAKVRLAGRATTTAVLSLLDAPPFRILRRTEFGPDIASGQARFEATVDFDLKKKILIDDVRFETHGTLAGVRSDKIVPGRLLVADELEFRADNARVEIGGPVRLGQVAADAVWHQEIGPGRAGHSTVSGQVELNQDFVREFRIGLPEGAVSGRATARFDIDLEQGQSPAFTLHSDLNRLALKIPALGWSKPANSTGRLEVRGRLGRDLGIEFLELEAAGLKAAGGSVTLRSGGLLDRATFKKVRVGGWLDAPVVLQGRGAGQAPLVRTTGGTLDIRKTSFAGAGGSGNARATGGGPVVLELDRVIISDGMMLTGFSGEFDTGGGFSGKFTARMNGGAALSGNLRPASNGTLIKIGSNNAGGVLRSAGIVEYANKGRMDLTLQPRARPGEYSGDLDIRNIKVKNAPGLTDLLAALSIVGLLEQLSGEGINFDEVDAKFRLTPSVVILQESSAVGPSLGLSLDGAYDLRSGRMDMQGVISPVFFLNGIGQVVSRRGEGLFGFSFRL